MRRVVRWVVHGKSAGFAVIVCYRTAMVQPHGTVIMRRTSGMGPGTGTRGRVRARTVARGGVRPVP